MSWTIPSMTEQMFVHPLAQRLDALRTDVLAAKQHVAAFTPGVDEAAHTLWKADSLIGDARLTLQGLGEHVATSLPGGDAGRATNTVFDLLGKASAAVRETGIPQFGSLALSDAARGVAISTLEHSANRIDVLAHLAEARGLNLFGAERLLTKLHL